MYQTPICPVLPDGNMDWEKMKQVGVDEELPHHVDPAATEWLSEKYEKYYPDVSKEEAAAFVTTELGKSIVEISPLRTIMCVCNRWDQPLQRSSFCNWSRNLK